MNDAADEVLTNSDSARWIRLCVDFESHEDFNEFPAGTPVLTHIVPVDGMGAPLVVGGASSGGAR